MSSFNECDIVPYKYNLTNKEILDTIDSVCVSINSYIVENEMKQMAVVIEMRNNMARLSMLSIKYILSLIKFTKNNNGEMNILKAYDLYFKTILFQQMLSSFKQISTISKNGYHTEGQTKAALTRITGRLVEIIDEKWKLLITTIRVYLIDDIVNIINEYYNL